jgi:hypothetical protein
MTADGTNATRPTASSAAMPEAVALDMSITSPARTLRPPDVSATAAT